MFFQCWPVLGAAGTQYVITTESQVGVCIQGEESKAIKHKISPDIIGLVQTINSIITPSLTIANHGFSKTQQETKNNILLSSCIRLYWM